MRIGVFDLNGLTESIGFWPTKTGTGVDKLDELQQLSDSGDSPHSIADGESYRKGDRLVRCGSEMSLGNWMLPVARVYHLVDSHWSLYKSQSVDGWELATETPTRFIRRGGKVDPKSIDVVYGVNPPHLGQPFTGPLLLCSERWRVHGDQILKSPQHRLPTVLLELDRLAGLAQAGKRSEFDSAVPPSSRSELWKLLQFAISVSYVGNDDESGSDTLCSPKDADRSDRGAGPKWFMHFRKRDGHWRLVRISH